MKMKMNEWRGIGSRRKCPNCKSIIVYRDKYSFIYAVELNKHCKICTAKQTAKKNKETGKLKGYNNPFFGKKHTKETKKRMSLTDRSYMVGNKNPMKSVKLRKYFSKLHSGIKNPMFGKHHSKSALKKISFHSKGKNNPMYGKPSPQGSGNGWANWYKGFHFRSIRELQFFIDCENNKLKCENAQSKFCIPYKNAIGENRTYRPDFLVNDELIVEIKPKVLWDTPTIKLKTKAAKQFCKRLGLKYTLLDIQPISSTLKEKYLNNEIKFVDKYKKRFEKYAGITKT